MSDDQLLQLLTARLQSADEEFLGRLRTALSPPATSAAVAPNEAPPARRSQRIRNRSGSSSSSHDSPGHSRHGRHRRHSRRCSRSSRCSRRSRSSRWRSPSTSEWSSGESGRRSIRMRPEPPPSRSLSLVHCEVPPVVVPPPPPTIPSGLGEFNYAGAWGAGSGKDGEVLALLRTLLDKHPLPPPNPGTSQDNTSNLPRHHAGVHKDVFFCGVSPLGSHVDSDTKDKIWANQYIDIWSLISVEQPSIDRERRFPDSRPYDRRPKPAKTMNNWIQAFAVMGCVMGQRHPERCQELFIYFDTIYNAYKSHGGSAWWRYDEEFRRRLSLHPDIGWGVKATDVWLRLMTAPQRSYSFPSAATAAGAPAAQGAVAVRRPGACWLYNEGHCRFAGLCKYRHECSSCGGTHPALRCRSNSGKSTRPSTSDPKDPGVRGRDGTLAKSIPQ
ncbi:uncharacterized protein [Dendropsophus ebraccatus]|uniref:uncharacterized protein isoform X1 n=1 Tax=Dendropsophus ebraccatus TaxID=150705 RepID=UPI00383149E7